MPGNPDSGRRPAMTIKDAVKMIDVDALTPEEIVEVYSTAEDGDTGAFLLMAKMVGNKPGGFINIQDTGIKSGRAKVEVHKR